MVKKGGAEMSSNDKLRYKLYNVYNHIYYRCNNINCEHYDRYGGRGIKMELGSFDEFFEKMKDSYKEHLEKFGSYNTTLERIDNDGNYSYNNIRWATRKEQAQNRVTTGYYTVYNTLDNSEIIINNAVEFCDRIGIAWTSFRSAADSGDAVKNFFIEPIYSTDLSSAEIQKLCDICKSIPVKTEVYVITNVKTGESISLFSIKEWCRENGVDPSGAYKCVRGIRHTCGGYTFKKTISEV